VIYGLYHSAAGMLTTEYAQEVTANNIANADTHGFKRAIATFAEREPAALKGLKSGVSDHSLASLSGGLFLGRTFTDYRPGPLEQSDQPTDVALEGRGFFMVRQDGETLLTRDGRFIKDAQGLLRSATDGAAVLNPNGAPIRLPRFGGELTIDTDGRIFQDGALVSQLAVTDVRDVDALQPVGSGRYRFNPEDEIAPVGRMRQHYVERSGVEPIKEMVNMIENARAYQMNARLLSLQDQTLGRLISVVT
jgi:flagellar basal-body rod protein FlgF